MAVVNSGFMVMAVLALVGLLICGSMNGAHGQACQPGNLKGLITKCAKYVQKSRPKVDPSNACCAEVKSTNVQCACQFVSKRIEEIIDMDKVVHVAEFCGNPLSHGMKCGSYTVP